MRNLCLNTLRVFAIVCLALVCVMVVSMIGSGQWGKLVFMFAMSTLVTVGCGAVYRHLF